MGHQNNQITIKDILSKHDNIYDALLAMQLNLFPLSSLDLVDIDNEKQYGSYYAFSIPIPAELVKEAVLTAKQSDNYLSRLVLKYSYIQLIVEYWIINKIYSICQSNPKLIGAPEFIKDYNSFNNYLCYHYLPYEEYAKNPEDKSNFGYTATFESMAKILLQSDKQIYKTISYKKESGYPDNSKEIIYNITDFEFAVDDAFRNTDFTLYDFIYDLFYYGVCKTLRASFQNGMINKYIPLYKLPEKTFTYKELNFKQLYGNETELELFLNIDRNIVRLECSTPKLLSDESIIIKSADNKYNNKLYVYQSKVPIKLEVDYRKFYIDEEGYIQGADIKEPILDGTNIKSKLIAKIGNGKLNVINAIILHRTVSYTTKSVFNTWLGKNVYRVGAHFVIDKDGTIYQCLSIYTKAHHVGRIRSKALETNNFQDDKDKKSVYDKKNNISALSNYEFTKEYPLRFPGNMDSIGIEVVSMYIKQTKQWEKATEAQLKSINLLIDILLTCYKKHNGCNLITKDIYPHDKIAYKTDGEGGGLYDYKY